MTYLVLAPQKVVVVVVEVVVVVVVLVVVIIYNMIYIVCTRCWVKKYLNKKI